MNKQWKLIVGITLLLGIAFYWYEWRPTQIRRECARKMANIFTPEQKNIYYHCLFKNGIKE